MKIRQYFDDDKLRDITTVVHWNDLFVQNRGVVPVERFEDLGQTAPGFTQPRSVGNGDDQFYVRDGYRAKRANAWHTAGPRRQTRHSRAPALPKENIPDWRYHNNMRVTWNGCQQILASLLISSLALGLSKKQLRQ